MKRITKTVIKDSITIFILLICIAICGSSIPYLLDKYDNMWWITLPVIGLLYHVFVLTLCIFNMISNVKFYKEFKLKYGGRSQHDQYQKKNI